MTTPIPDERNQALKPYLDRLSALGRTTADPEAPLRINVGGESFQVEPWERDAVLASFEGPQSRGTQRWRTLLAQGVALRAKTLSDVQKLARRGGSDAGLIDELRTDATIGFALLDELQRAVDQAVVGGEMEHANRLTQFRNKLSRSIDGLEAQLGGEGLAETRLLSGELVALPGRGRETSPEVEAAGAAPTKESPDTASVAALVKLEEELLKRQQEREREREAAPEPVAPRPVEQPVQPRPTTRTSRSRILVAVLAGLILAWLWFVVRPSFQRSQMPAFSKADFTDLPSITQVVARPPSLFVTVDEDAWSAMPPAERLATVQSVGRRLSVAGYTGAHVKDTDGRTVGQWLKNAGAKLVGSDR